MTAAPCPTRNQWRLLATFRDGPSRRIGRFYIGNLRTSDSVRRRGWVVFDNSIDMYKLSDAGRDALAAGDRRYQESETAYARRPL